MSGESRRAPWLPSAAERDRVARVGATATRVLFGGRAGLALFLGALALYVLTWRAGVLFNDIELYVAMLDRLAGGALALGAVGEFGGSYPGMHHVDGQVYGRGYGLVAFALPVLWGLELLDPLVELRALVVVGWSALLFATAALVGDYVGHRRRGFAAGAVLAALALAANAAVYQPLQVDAAVLALQLSAMLAAAVTVLFVYRLLAHRHGVRAGALGGATALLGTPVAFWASTPKRHALVAMFVVVAVYAFARSRAGETPRRRQTGFRALAYACGGVVTWIHAPEGFTLVAALAVVDLPTAPRNDRRTLATVGGAFALSLLPFFVTNALISGNPLLPPHFLDSFHQGMAAELTDAGAGGGADAGSADGAGAGGSEGTGTGGTGTDADGGFWPVAVAGALVGAAGSLLGEVQSVLPLVRRGVRMYVSGFVALFTEPSRFFGTFVRWGAGDRDPANIFFDGRTNLSVLESAPVVAALVALPLRRRIGEVRSGAVRLRDAVDPVDLLVAVYAALLVFLYVNHLPVHVQATVRYLHPIYPLIAYGLFRVPRVRSVLTGRPRPAVYGFEATVLFGAPLVFAALRRVDATKGDVVQPFGLVALAVAAILAVAIVVSGRDERAEPVAAAAFGVAAGTAALYLLLTAFVLMHYGTSALPAVDVIAGEIRWYTLI